MRKFARYAASIAVVAALALSTAACSSGGSSDSSSGQKVTLSYWGGAGTEKVVADWNKTHPNIQVKAVNVQGGDALTTKLLTAIKAGSGAPDVVGMEYQTLPTLIANNAVQDLSKVGAKSLQDDFTSSAWKSVTVGGTGVYGIPVDTGPMMFYYRKDVFDQLGLSAPKTWAEYADDAKKVHAANPSSYLGTFSSSDSAWFAGLTQQAGASWWSTSGKSWSVDIDSKASQKVASYWGDLVNEGVIQNQPQFTPAWNAAVNDGGQVGWISSVWGAGVLASNAPDTAGKWAVAELPNWRASKSTSGNWGGGANVVTTQSKHPQQALEFIKWMSTSKAGVASFVKNVQIYPADVKQAKTLTTPPSFVSDQSNFYDLAANSADNVVPVTYGPDVNVAFSAYTDSFGSAVQSKDPDDFLAALKQMQSTVVADMKKSGYTVK